MFSQIINIIAAVTQDKIYVYTTCQTLWKFEKRKVSPLSRQLKMRQRKQVCDFNGTRNKSLARVTGDSCQL